MTKKPPPHKRLVARKKPSQARSEKMVARILDATRALIKQSGKDESVKLTTNHIAREAGISVGSLYQYFPNTESILYEIYQQVTSGIHAVLDRYDSARYLSLPREEFFSKLNRAALRAEPDPEITYEFHRAIRVYPPLAEADRAHAEEVARKMANFLKHYGSPWPIKKLQRLTLFFYYINFGTWLYRDHIRPPKKESEEWELGAMDYVLNQCFGE